MKGNVCHSAYPVTHRSVTLSIVYLFVLCMELCKASLSISEFSKIKQNSNLMSGNQVTVARSLLDCSQHCSDSGSGCGFSYQKIQRTCVCLNDLDYISPEFVSLQDSAVYLHIYQVCIYNYTCMHNNGTYSSL